MSTLVTKWLSAAGALAIVAGCSSPQEVSEDLGVAQPVALAQSTSTIEKLGEEIAAEAEPVDFADNAEQGEALREFSYSWPRQVSAAPKLVALLEVERNSDLAQQKTMWAESLAEFPGDECYSCKQLAYSREWKVVANLDRFLSLSADHFEYTGGAHGNYWFDGKVWDRETETALDARDLFASPDALWAAIETPYCNGLDAERVKRNPGQDVEQMGWGCPGLDQLTVLVGSSNGETFDRLGLLAAPYVAGSYAEGSYEVTLPVTEQVLAIVKPDYSEAFTIQ